MKNYSKTLLAIQEARKDMGWAKVPQARVSEAAAKTLALALSSFLNEKKS